MHNHTLILCLIQQELKYAQLIGGLNKLGFETHVHNLSLLEVIVPLLGIALKENGELPEISEELSDTYYQYLEKAVDYPLTVRGEALEPLAEKCLESLTEIICAD